MVVAFSDSPSFLNTPLIHSFFLPFCLLNDRRRASLGLLKISSLFLFLLLLLSSLYSHYHSSSDEQQRLF